MNTETLKTQVGYYLNQVNRNTGFAMIQADAIQMALRLAKWSAFTPYGCVLAEFRLADDGWNVYVLANGQAYNFTTQGEIYSVSIGGPAIADRSDRKAWLQESNDQRAILRHVIKYLLHSGQTPKNLLEAIQKSEYTLWSLTKEISA